MNDPLVKNQISWVRGADVDFLQGEKRDTGRIWHVKGWHRWTDRRKLRYLREFAESYGNDPQMRWFTVQNVLEPAGAEPRDYKAQAAAILRYTQGLYYANEPGEQIQSPWATIREKTGDCDDLAVLIATMAESIKLPWRYVIAGKDRQGRPYRYHEQKRAPARGANFYHIYVDLGWPPFAPTTWAAAEPTIRGLPLGHDVVTDGMPDGVRGGSDVSYSGAQQAAPVIPVKAQLSLLDDPEVKAYLDEQNPFAIVRGYGWRGLWAKVPWVELFIGVIQGVFTAAAIAFFVDRRLSK
jgi:transglutaminase-like putative cysteine protease